MFIFICALAPNALSAHFDTIVTNAVSDKGIYDGKSGVIYASKCENNTMLAVVFTENSALTIKIYGSENEVTDFLHIDYKNKPNLRISISPPEEELCISVTEGKKGKYYRLINDTLTLTSDKPENTVNLLKVSNQRLDVKTTPSEVIGQRNNLTRERIENIPLRELSLSEAERTEILHLLKACADIYTFNSDDYDINELTMRVLYTHRNFQLLSNINPQTAQNTSIKMCSEQFIAESMHKAFRITPPKPALNMLTQIGYCYNNGLYYYTGGYNEYFATDITDIIKIYAIKDNSIYVIFKNSYTDSNTPVGVEFSSATIKKDSEGYYLSSLQMGKLIDNPQELISPDTINASGSIYTKYIPLFVILIAVAVTGIVIYFYIL